MKRLLQWFRKRREPEPDPPWLIDLEKARADRLNQIQARRVVERRKPRE